VTCDRGAAKVKTKSNEIKMKCIGLG
jgi:hypothetical protein